MKEKKRKIPLVFIEIDKDTMRVIELMKAGSEITGEETARNTVGFLFGNNGLLYYDALLGKGR